MAPRYIVSLPEYSLKSKPHFSEWGEVIDATVREHFIGQSIALRYLSAQDHSEKTVHELANIIETTGSDRYDAMRSMSVSHDFYSQFSVELFAVPVKVDCHLAVSGDALKDFWEGAQIDRGYSLRIDLITVYDLRQLVAIPIQYEDGIGEDAFCFKNPDSRQDAVLGFIIIE